MSPKQRNTNKSHMSRPGTSSLPASVFRNYKQILGLIVAVLVATFSYIVWYQTKSGATSLINASVDSLKEAFFGEYPHVFYCHEHGNEAYIPAKLVDASKILNSRHKLAIVNCSQQLPSGKTIMSRFKLKTEWKPTIFSTAPWSKPTQIPPLSLKDSTKMANFLTSSLSPRPLMVSSDKDFRTACGWPSGKASASETCILVVRGERYGSDQDQVVERIVETFYKTRVLSVSAKQRRLSVERTEAVFDPQNYAMKLYSIRNGTHYMPMRDSPTWDNVQKFVTSAISAPLGDYYTPDSGDVKLVKPPINSAASKRRSKNSKPDTSESADSSFNSIETPVEDDVNEELLRAQREAERREAMEREKREFFYADDSYADSYAESNGCGDDDCDLNEEYDEDIIEL